VHCQQVNQLHSQPQALHPNLQENLRGGLARSQHQGLQRNPHHSRHLSQRNLLANLLANRLGSRQLGQLVNLRVVQLLLGKPK
jgi:hypothetical protein